MISFGLLNILYNVVPSGGVYSDIVYSYDARGRVSLSSVCDTVRPGSACCLCCELSVCRVAVCAGRSAGGVRFVGGTGRLRGGARSSRIFF